MAVADHLVQPTRGCPLVYLALKPCGLGLGAGRTSPPIWPCSDWGLPCRRCYQRRGGLLPHRFTLTLHALSRGPAGRSTLCCPVRRLSAPRRYLAVCPAELGLSSKRPCDRPATITLGQRGKYSGWRDGTVERAVPLPARPARRRTGGRCTERSIVMSSRGSERDRGIFSAGLDDRGEDPSLCSG